MILPAVRLPLAAQALYPHRYNSSTGGSSPRIPLLHLQAFASPRYTTFARLRRRGGFPRQLLLRSSSSTECYCFTTSRSRHSSVAARPVLHRHAQVATMLTSPAGAPQMTPVVMGAAAASDRGLAEPDNTVSEDSGQEATGGPSGVAVRGDEVAARSTAAMAYLAKRKEMCSAEEQRGREMCERCRRARKVRTLVLFAWTHISTAFPLRPSLIFNI